MVDMTDMYVRIYIYYIYISIHFLNEQILHIYDIHRCMYVFANSIIIVLIYT